MAIDGFEQDPEKGDIITIGLVDRVITNVSINYPQYPAVPVATLTLDQSASFTANTVYNISGKANPLGFYTYKIVIKQLQEEYYNAYLGNVISGGFKDQKDSTGTLAEQGIFRTSISYASLFADNVSKIPADLEEVEPNQQLFATNTTKLFPRVSSTINIGDTGTFTKQFFVGNNTVKKSNPFVTGIFSGKLTDLNALDLAAATPLTGVGFVNAQQDPIGFKFNTNGEVIGVPVVTPTYVNTSFINSDLRLNVMEVEPPKSELQIYYETACAGLIRDLNNLIETGDNSTSTTPAPPANDDAVSS
jgi:hypothetical protein